MSFIHTVLNKYEVLSSVSDTLQRIVDTGWEPNTYVVFTRLKSCKQTPQDLPEHFQGPEGLVAFPASCLMQPSVSQFAEKFKYAHLVKDKSNRRLTISDATTDQKAEEIIQRFNDGMQHVGFSGLHKDAIKTTKQQLKTAGVNVQSPAGWVMAFTQHNLMQKKFSSQASFMEMVKASYRVEAADIIPIRTGKPQTPPLPKQIKEGTPEHTTRQHVEYAKMHGIPLEHLVTRYSQQPQFHEKFDDVMKQTHDEPYYGVDRHTEFRDDKAKAVKEPIPFSMPVVVKDLKGILGKGVLQGTGADPFMWMDDKYGATKSALKSHHDKKLEIHTRSDLVAHDDYIELLNPHLHTVYMHLFTEDEKVARAVEPGCPSAKRRLKAAQKLLDNGIRVVIALDMLKVDPFTRKGLHNELSPATKSHFKTDENQLDLSTTEQTRLNKLVKENASTPEPESKPVTVVPLRK